MHNRFWWLINSKTHSSTLSHEKIILDTKKDLKYVNLDTYCKPQELKAFIHLVKKYRDVFAWTYDELKTYDMWIIHHVIPIMEGTKPYQQLLRKIHPMLEILIQMDFRKLLDAQIIHKV